MIVYVEQSEYSRQLLFVLEDTTIKLGDWYGTIDILLVVYIT